MKKIFTLAIFFFSAIALFALPFSDNFTEAEKQKLLNGEILIRNISNSKNLSLTEKSPITKKFVQKIKKNSPTLCAEVIQIRPYAENENILPIIKELVLDLPSYLEIPYYSVQYNASSPLFSVAEQKNLKVFQEKTIIEANLKMDPFSQFEAEIQVEESTDSLYFMTENINKIKYTIFTAAKPHQMNAGLIVFRDGENWILYAAGGIHTGFLFFLQNRIERAFVNRINDFTTYFIKKL